MNDMERKYQYWLGRIRGISGRKKLELLGMSGRATELYKIPAKEMKYFTCLTEKERERLVESRKVWNVEREYEQLQQKGISYVSAGDNHYPEKLRSIPASPFGIYVKGKLPDEHVPAVAIVGARDCSNYGRTLALEFGRVLTANGAAVISGLARGVDSYAQRGAVEYGGTYGVLGSGVDICYPPENFELYQKMTRQGGVISEYPPETQPKPFYFPARNRIISGLADAVLVIEAREKSGSLITADMALEQGRDVYAVPGRVGDCLSIGCNRLIQQGAGLIISPENLLNELDIIHSKYDVKNKKNKKILETDEDLVYSCLDLHPKNMNQLFQQLPYTIMELSRILMSLELKGYIIEAAKNYYVRTTMEEDGG